MSTIDIEDMFTSANTEDIHKAYDASSYSSDFEYVDYEVIEDVRLTRLFSPFPREKR